MSPCHPVCGPERGRVSYGVPDEDCVRHAATTRNVIRHTVEFPSGGGRVRGTIKGEIRTLSLTGQHERGEMWVQQDNMMTSTAFRLHFTCIARGKRDAEPEGAGAPKGPPRQPMKLTTSVSRLSYMAPAIVTMRAVASLGQDGTVPSDVGHRQVNVCGAHRVHEVVVLRRAQRTVAMEAVVRLAAVCRGRRGTQAVMPSVRQLRGIVRGLFPTSKR